MKIIETLGLVTPQLTAKSIFRQEWKSPAHINHIEEKLIDTFDSGNKKLIINIPPRHGKSQFITKVFPLWWLLNRPTARIILAAYNSTLA